MIDWNWKKKYNTMKVIACKLRMKSLAGSMFFSWYEYIYVLNRIITICVFQIKAEIYTVTNVLCLYKDYRLILIIVYYIFNCCICSWARVQMERCYWYLLERMLVRERNLMKSHFFSIEVFVYFSFYISLNARLYSHWTFNRMNARLFQS